MADPTCAGCGATIRGADQFCEVCGTPSPAHLLDAATAAATAAAARDGAGPDADVEAASTPTRPADRTPPAPGMCGVCGAAFDPDGYCTQCGAKQPSPRDHFEELPAAWTAGVCDRGIRHARNEDAMALVASATAGEFCALVVSDGVSTASNSDVASLAAAHTARDVLSAPRPTDIVGPSAVIEHWTDAIGLASDRANEAVCAVPVGATAPSATFVVAVLDGEMIVAGNVGDSRAYWLPDDGIAQQLTADDSGAADQIALGVPRSVAEVGPYAHAITRWLGPDSPDAHARCSTTATDGRAGWLLVCSDGLWNYCSDASMLHDVVRQAVGTPSGDAADPDPAALARALVAWANTQGGHDNITVALARVPAATSRRGGV